MISDIEIICQALEQYSCNTAEKLFGISSLPAKTLVRYSIRNLFNKYGKTASLLLEGDNGKMDAELLFNAFRSELKNKGGFTIFGIKFTDSDIDEILKIYNTLQENNI